MQRWVAGRAILQKNNVRYRFYVSAALLKGRKASAGSRARVSSVDIETAVINALRTRLPDCSLSDLALVMMHVKLSVRSAATKLLRPPGRRPTS